MEALALEVTKLAAEMGNVTPARRGAYLSHMAAKETFATIDDQSLARSTDRMITASAVSLLVAALAL